MGDDDIVHLLLEKGAAVDATNKFGWTPIHRAAWFSQVSITQCLLSKGPLITLAMNVLESHKMRQQQGQQGHDGG